jgi:ATPase subunit of ABC transporter with duplicated ATPase domains
LGGVTLGAADLRVKGAGRVAITGPNGAGKSTLIGVLLGRVPLSSGSASLGSGISVGEVDLAR